MRLVEFHDENGKSIPFDADRFCYAHAHYEAEPPPGGSAPDLHSTIICHMGQSFLVQEEIEKVYEILKGVA